MHAWAVPIVLLVPLAVARAEPEPGPANPVVSTVTLTPPALRLTVGATQALKATAEWADGGRADVTASAAWSSTVPAVATVERGTVVAVGPGSATITAAIDGGSGIAIVDVAAAPTVVPEVPIPKRPWFWAVVGAGAAVVIGAVVVGAAVGGRHDPAPTAGMIQWGP